MTTGLLQPEITAATQATELSLVARPDEMNAVEHEAIVERVASAFRAAKRDEATVTAEYRVAGEWADFLRERYGVFDAMLAGDVTKASGLLRGFWRNELGPIVKEYARFDQLADGDAAAQTRFVREVKRNLRIWKDIFRAEASALRIPNVGNPWGLRMDDELIAPKATRFHALATQVGELIRNVSSPVVLEIGGGYGGFAYYLMRDHEEVTYVDLDLPETLALASYYLLACHPDRRFLLYGEAPTPNSRDQMTEYDAVLMPNFVFPTVPTNSVDVVVNTFSLSEVVRPTLNEYIRQIERVCCGFFLHHNMDRPGVINRGSERIPASQFPIRRDAFRLIYKHHDLFHGAEGDYRDFLYQRISSEKGIS